MKSLLALSLSALISVSASSAFASETKAAAKPDLAKGQEKATQVCAACHTADGSRGSPANPILQGQHAEYLVKQLTEYKAGTRANAIMTGIASAIGDSVKTPCHPVSPGVNSVTPCHPELGVGGGGIFFKKYLIL